MCTGAEGFMQAHADKMILAGGVMDAVGKITGAKASYDYANYQADQLNADAAATRGFASIGADKIRRAGKTVQGQARAAYGASGVSVNSGSAAAVQEDIARRAGEDALTELLTGGYRAASMESTAAARRIAGRNAMFAGVGSAGRSLLSSYADQQRANAEADRWRRAQERSRQQIAGMTIPPDPGNFDFGRYEP